MFIVESRNTKGAKKRGILSVIVLLLMFHGAAVLGSLLTLHIVVRPSPPAPRGFRVLGFPRPKSP